MTIPLWLTFLPLDVRKSFSLESRLSGQQQTDLVHLALKVAILVTDSYCVVNPLSLIEDTLSLSVSRDFLPAFDMGMIRLSSTEGDLIEHFSNKEAEYRGVADEYGLERVALFLREIYPYTLVHWRFHSIGESIEQQFRTDQTFETIADLFAPAYAYAAWEALPQMAQRLRSEGRSLTWRDFASVAPPSFVVDRRLELVTLRAYFEAQRLMAEHTILSNIPYLEGLDKLLTPRIRVDFRAILLGLSKLGILEKLARASVHQLISLISPETQRLLRPGLTTLQSGSRLAGPLGIGEVLRVAASRRKGVLNAWELSSLRLGIERACELARLPHLLQYEHVSDILIESDSANSGRGIERSTVLIGEVVMGDKFDNIGAGAIIVNRSKVEGAIATSRQRYGSEAADLLRDLGEFVAASGNPQAAEHFNDLTTEAAKEEPDESKMRKLLGFIRAALPDVLNVTRVIDSLQGVFT